VVLNDVAGVRGWVEVNTVCFIDLGKVNHLETSLPLSECVKQSVC
jgi:hypothetical protein